MHTGMPLKVWLSVPTLSIVPLKADSVLQVPLFLSVILAHFIFLQVTLQGIWFSLFSKDTRFPHNAWLLYYLDEVPDSSS